ncbi:MAG TPA: chemotaxis protein CheW [Steroidobacteraceae bacterium]|jgi:purine-binding chemotaxis protein CheW|nr:chemotaxis protein CheW [Steroidobacteraceae bacterium]
MDPAATKSAAHSSIVENADQYLTFQLAGQTYGVEILRVQEIKGWERPTRLPHSPPYVQGVINLRGAVVPIVDLRCRFGLGETEYGRTTVVIVVKVQAPRGELTAGVVVDGVCEVCNVSAQDLRPPPEVGAAIDAHFVHGLAMVDEQMLILLDVTRLIISTLDEPASSPKAA